MPWRALVLLCIAIAIQSAERPVCGFGGLDPSEYLDDFDPMYVYRLHGGTSCAFDGARDKGYLSLL